MENVRYAFKQYLLKVLVTITFSKKNITIRHFILFCFTEKSIDFSSRGLVLYFI